MPRTISKVLWGMSGGLVLSVTILYLLLFDWRPRIDIPRQLADSKVMDAKRLIADTIPGDYTRAAEKRLLLSENELSVILNFLLRQYHYGAISVSIHAGKIKLKLSVRLTEDDNGPYLNTKLVARQTGNRFELRTLKIGSLHVPAWLSAWITRIMLGNSPFVEYDRLFHQQIQAIQLAEDQVQIDYTWDPRALTEVASMIRNQADRELVQVYKTRIREILSDHDEVQIALVEMLRPLFVLANQRSRDGADPVDENRALLVALSRHLHHRQLTSDVSSLDGTTALDLNERRDLAYHFISSASLAATSSEKFSDLVGFYKEIHDSDQGAGFSFSDMTANRAGTRFGEYAVSSGDNARKLQEFISTARDNSVFMPPTRQIPDALKQVDFNNRFGAMQGPAYEQMKNSIEEAIAARPVYSH